MLLSLRRSAALGAALLALSACAARAEPQTPAPVTNTPYPFVTATPRPTETPHTPTLTSTPFPTSAPTFTATPGEDATPAETATVTASPAGTPTPQPCPDQPEGIFRQVTRSDPELAAALGCVTAPQGEQPQVWRVVLRIQPMERGYLLWQSNVGWHTGQPVITVLRPGGTYSRFDDTYQPGIDRAAGGPPPPEGLHQPTESLGKVWRIIPGLVEELGFGIEPESRFEGEMVLYQNGELLYLPPLDGVLVLRRGTPNHWALYLFREPEPADG